MIVPSHTVTAVEIPTLTPSLTRRPHTTTPTITSTISKSSTPPATATQVFTPTSIYDNIVNLAPGMYIEIKDFIREQSGYQRYETGLVSVDGKYMAHLYGNGGPIDPTGKKMVIWDSPAPDEGNCSDLRILDLPVQKIVSGNGHPTGYEACEWVTWSLDGKTLFFIGDRLDIAAYNPETKQTTQLLHDASSSTNGFNLLALSPDGQWLAFFRNGFTLSPFGHGRWIYILDLSCQKDPPSCIQHVWTVYKGGSVSPLSWMPGGKLTQLESTLDKEDFLVFDVKEGTVIKTINVTRNTYADYAAWSPDGKWVAVSSLKNIFLIPSSGGEPISLTRLTGVEGDVLGWVIIPSLTTVH